MRITYECPKCGYIFYKNFSSLPAFNFQCPKCKATASRKYGKVPVTKENESVSGALQTMLYSKKPSETN